MGNFFVCAVWITYHWWSNYGKINDFFCFAFYEMVKRNAIFCKILRMAFIDWKLSEEKPCNEQRKSREFSEHKLYYQRVVDNLSRE